MRRGRRTASSAASACSPLDQQRSATLSPEQSQALSTDVQVATIMTPPDSPWQPVIAQQCMVGLYAIPASLSLQIRATEQGISWHVEAPQSVITMVERAFYGLYPQIEITVKNKRRADVGLYLYPLQAAAPFVGPLQHATDLKEIDPLAGVLTAMSHLAAGETVVYSLTLNPPAQDYQKLGARHITRSADQWRQFLTPRLAMEAAMFQVMVGAERQVPRFVPDIQRCMERKLRMPCKEVDFTVKVGAASRARADALAGLLAPGLAVFAHPGLNSLAPAHPRSYRLVLAAPEVAAFWHLPSEDCRVPGIQWAADISVPLPAALERI